MTHLLPGAAVVDCRYAVDAARPYWGVSPLQWARQTGALAGNLELRLSEETGASVGAFVPYPADPGTDSEDADDPGPTQLLRRDIRAGKGRILLVETTAAGLGEGRSAAPAGDWQSRRFGANPPATLRDLRGDASIAILGACGVPPDLCLPSTAQGAREAFRRFILASVEPLAALVATELSEKLEATVRFDFTDTFAHDLAGRAMSFQRMVTAGMAPDKAAALSGLTIAEVE